MAPSLVHQAFASFRSVADRGVPVFIVPGNHERSRIPHARFALHPSIHLFDRPRSVEVRVRGACVRVGGIPYVRRDVRSRFRDLVGQTGLMDGSAEVRLLCVHHCVEGATVGPNDFTFRGADDVIRARDIPQGVAAVLSGHIHRHQVLTQDLAGRPIAAPVFYPGSVERTSIAEMDEPKGYLRMSVRGGPLGGEVAEWSFVRLPARPMLVRELRLEDVGHDRDRLERWIESTISRLPRDAVVRLRVCGRLPPGFQSLLSAKRVRRIAPRSMNVDLVLIDGEGNRLQPRERSAPGVAEQTSLAL